MLENICKSVTLILEVYPRNRLREAVKAEVSEAFYR